MDVPVSAIPKGIDDSVGVKNVDLTDRVDIGKLDENVSTQVDRTSSLGPGSAVALSFGELSCEIGCVGRLVSCQMMHL